jgi:hypothetical protein
MLKFEREIGELYKAWQCDAFAMLSLSLSDSSETFAIYVLLRIKALSYRICFSVRESQSKDCVQRSRQGTL